MPLESSPPNTHLQIHRFGKLIMAESWIDYIQRAEIFPPKCHAYCSGEVSGPNVQTWKPKRRHLHPYLGTKINNLTFRDSGHLQLLVEKMSALISRVNKGSDRAKIWMGSSNKCLLKVTIKHRENRGPSLTERSSTCLTSLVPQL